MQNDVNYNCILQANQLVLLKKTVQDYTLKLTNNHTYNSNIN